MVLCIRIKKRKWSAPGPDRITNYWWKKANSLREGVSNAFVNIVQHDHEYPLWFAEGKTSLIPKAGEFSVKTNVQLHTCRNNMYKWFTSCMLKPMSQQLDKYALIERRQSRLQWYHRHLPHRSYGVQRQQEKQEEPEQGMD